MDAAQVVQLGGHGDYARRAAGLQWDSRYTPVQRACCCPGSAADLPQRPPARGGRSAIKGTRCHVKAKMHGAMQVLQARQQQARQQMHDQLDAPAQQPSCPLHTCSAAACRLGSSKTARRWLAWWDHAVVVPQTTCSAATRRLGQQQDRHNKPSYERKCRSKRPHACPRT